MVRARAVVDLAHALDADLERRSATRLLREVELPLTGVLARMEETGIAADVDHLAHLEATYGGEVKRAAQAAYDAVGREFNLGSPKQLQVILFDELELPKTKKIKTGYTTDADALAWLAAERPPVIPALLRHRDVSPAQDGRRLADPDGRRRTAGSTPRSTRWSRRPAGCPAPTRTCRTSRSAPPRAARSGRRSSSARATSRLLTADYSQIEMRIMAHLSEDAGPHRRFHVG